MDGTQVPESPSGRVLPTHQGHPLGCYISRNTLTVSLWFSSFVNWSRGTSHEDGCVRKSQNVRIGTKWQPLPSLALKRQSGVVPETKGLVVFQILFL